MVGYVLCKFYETKPLYFGSFSYAPSCITDSPNTILINEIAVLQSEQGNGIAANLLDMCLFEARAAHSDSNKLSTVECCVLAENISSEMIFTKFAQRHGVGICFGATQFSEWGNYINWKITLGEKVEQLKICDKLFDKISFSSGFQGYLDRQALIERAKERQSQRKS